MPEHSGEINLWPNSGQSMRGKITSKYRTNLQQDYLLSTNLATILLLNILFSCYNSNSIESASINYGIGQIRITDVNQLMPVLCQNQSVICEGSFCIPGVKKCVCDLRQPVAFGRFCLRQVDIDTKCFVTNQCNHTVQDAVCIDTNSQAVLDYESSKFKIEQWQHLNDLRQMSQSAQSKDLSNKQTITNQIKASVTTGATTSSKPIYMAFERNVANSGYENGPNLEAYNNVIISNLRNSPYEINTPELMEQNHTRRKQPVDPSLLLFNLSSEEARPPFLVSRDSTLSDAVISEARSSILNNQEPTTSMAPVPISASSFEAITSTLGHESSTATTNSDVHLGEPSKKRLVVKTPNWPPGVCSCPHGFMFDAMLRKCLGLSLADAHCQTDNDCKQIKLTHCSQETRKCECDEPFVWNQSSMSCQRPSMSPKKEFFTTVSPILFSSPPTANDGSTTLEASQTNASLNIIFSPIFFLLALLVLLPGCSLVYILATSNCTKDRGHIISPRNSKQNKNKAKANQALGSTYATLKRPEHHQKHTQLTKATRGRILNYDFEQDSPTANGCTTQSTQQLSYSSSATMNRPHHSKNEYRTTTTIERQTGGGTLSRLKMHMHKSGSGQESNNDRPGSKDKVVTEANDGKGVVRELDDNISISQFDLDAGAVENSKSETNSLAAIAGPPPPVSNQPPPYMLASSSMKVQGSAIAAAAAAVANRRMQMAQKKTAASAVAANDQQQLSSKTVTNCGDPVFL